MCKNEYNVIGVMSGTSLDGVDLLYTSLNFNKRWQFKILKCKTIPYNKSWKRYLGNLIDMNDDELAFINKKYTAYLSNLISHFISANKIENIDLVSSHGHTAKHEPKKGFTLQIGNLPAITKEFSATVVCNFRANDVKLGGEGAPLVPIGDQLLFYEYDYCVNLGGFANVSMEKENKRIAFDICPVNIVLNHYVSNLGFDYDNAGEIASTGNINTDLLSELNKLEYYSKSNPKSLGLEWVNCNIFPLINSFNLNTKDILRTFVEHCAIQINNSMPKTQKDSILVTGGGAFNTFLINRISKLRGRDILIPNKDLIEFKEALVFALLGVLRLRNEVNCLSSVTGARKDHSSGTIYYV